jgi:hypothetical protein
LLRQKERDMGTLKAGITTIDITPPIGATLQGYGSRDHGAEGIHDSLYAQALVLDDGACRIAIVACDLIGLEKHQTDEARRIAAELSDIDPKHVMFCCSHTHGGPAMNTAGYVVGEPYTIETTIRKLAGAVACSANNLRHVRIGTGRGKVRIGVNRREMRAGRIVLGENYAGLIDPEVIVTRIDAEHGEPLAALFNYACHGTTLGGDNYLITADFVGYARTALEGLIPGGTVTTMFVNGCAGDINPFPRGSFEEARKRGAALGAEAAKVWQNIGTAPEAVLRSASGTIGLPVSPPPPLAQLKTTQRAAAKQWTAVRKAGKHSPTTKLELDWAREMIRRRTKGGMKRKIPCELHALRIGHLGIVGVPGEVLVQIGLNIKKRSKFAHTIPAAYTNDRLGYLPTAKASAEGGYETQSHIYWREQAWAPSIEKTLTKGAVSLLNSLA